ncbi:CerR family C-terminal domain-containing protein [Paraburkholderia bannensis]|uniref:CerR family C-terminal domain-containing protein n=1 Tax=Paraburkholderia bannensis TaxID=765414 RepID=UPI002ABE2B28|nr:CerR family C-terminal domain-containing protein [Paraburkholderia bannensis]
MSETRLLRRQSEGGYARGDETRRKIIDAGIKLFGQLGFSGVSTRDIETLAGVKAPALQYYFDSKEGLYRACAESLAEAAWTSFGQEVQTAWMLLERPSESDELIEAFIQLQDAVTDLMLRGCDNDKRLFFEREQNGGEPEIGTQILRERMRAPLHKVAVALLARICGLSSDDSLAIVRTLSLYGQPLIFHLSRESMLPMFEWRELDASKVAFLKTTIGEQTRILLKHWRNMPCTPREN